MNDTMMNRLGMAALVALGGACSGGTHANPDGGSPTDGGATQSLGNIAAIRSVNPGADSTSIEVCLDQTRDHFVVGHSLCTGGAVCCLILGTAGGTCSSQTNVGTLTLLDGTTTLGSTSWNTSTQDLNNSTFGPVAVAAGDILKVSATGGNGVTSQSTTAPEGAIPAFNAQVQAQPDGPILTPADGGSVVLSSTQDTIVTWNPQNTPGPGALFQIALRVQNVGYIGCYPQDSAGTVTIPQTLVRQLVTAAGGGGINTSTTALMLARTTQVYPVVAPNIELTLQYTYEWSTPVSAIQ